MRLWNKAPYLLLGALPMQMTTSYGSACRLLRHSMSYSRRMLGSVIEPASRSIPFDVGGVTYPLLVSDIAKFPGSFFQTAIEKELQSTESSITVQRDGLLFRYIHAFLVNGALPRTKGKLALSADTIQALKQEADFFKLPTLQAECDIPERDIAKCDKGADAELEHYHTIREFIGELVWSGSGRNTIECEYPTGYHEPADLVVQLGNIVSPFCVQDTLEFDPYNAQPNAPLFKSSTLGALNIPELLAECDESAFGRGTETVFDPAVRKSFEIPASKLNQRTLKSLANEMICGCYSLAPNLDLELRPYKLVIYQEGGHFHAHRDTVRGDGHIGTAVLVLNSEYTGGELEITHNGHTEVVTGPYSWVAMYGDCLHKINPVTSGTRVSLILDIYATRAEVNDYSFWDTERWNVERDEKLLSCTETSRAAILAGIEKELIKFDNLIICLAHKYPLSQVTPDFLKGSDRALYELLKDTYDTQVVACGINTLRNDSYKKPSVGVQMFTSFENPKKAEDPDSNGEAERTKFLIPAPINADSVLDYSPCFEHLGNQAHPETAVYLVSGLQLCRRA